MDHVEHAHAVTGGARGVPVQNILELRAKRQGSANQMALPLPEVDEPAPTHSTTGVMAGKKCPDCGAHAVIKKDGCEYCTQCGFVGACG